MKTNNDTIYRELQEAIDTRMPVGFPKADSDIEIRILKHLFSPEEARIAIQLGPLPESLKRIYKRIKKSGIDISIEELESILNGLVTKGSIMGGKIFPGSNQYSLAQFVIGMYEFQVDRQTKEFARDAEEYIESRFYREFHRKGTPSQMRTIPVEKSIIPNRRVSTYDDVRKIVKNVKGPIVLLNCVCKQTKDLLEEPCKMSDTRNCCITFNHAARFMLDRNVPSAREVTRQELMTLLENFQETGYILQPANSQNPGFICACCGCCCAVLSTLKKFDKPAEHFHSNYYAQVNAELCTGCEDCIDRCQMDSIEMVDEISTINADRCIGCGNCTTVCEQSALTLREKSKKMVPPINNDSLYLKILKKNSGISAIIRIIVKRILGKV